MALLHVEDYYDQKTRFGIDFFDSAPGSSDIQAAAGRFASTNGFSMGARFINSGAYRPFPARDEVYLGFAWNQGATPSAVDMVRLLGDNNTTTHVIVGQTAGRNLTIKIGSTLVATSVNPVLRIGWTYIEVHAKLSDTVGVVEVRTDGIVTPAVSFSGDTRNGGTTPAFDTYTWFWVQGNSVGDTYLLDTTPEAAGPPMNDFQGECKVCCSFPTGAGSSTGFTPSTGANWQNVDEAVASTTDYNSSAVSGTRDTYAMSDLVSVATILAVRQDTWAHRADTDPISLKPAVKIGSTVYYGSPASLGSVMAADHDNYVASPATGTAWTVAEFNSAEFGAEVV